MFFLSWTVNFGSSWTSRQVGSLTLCDPNYKLVIIVGQLHQYALYYCFIVNLSWFVLPYVSFYLCNFQFTTHTQGHSPIVLYTYARCDCRVPWGPKVKVKTPRLTGNRWTYQLMVNHLYFSFKPYVGIYGHCRPSSLRDKASRSHQASPLAGAVPTASLFFCVTTI